MKFKHGEMTAIAVGYEVVTRNIDLLKVHTCG